MSEAWAKSTADEKFEFLKRAYREATSESHRARQDMGEIQAAVIAMQTEFSTKINSVDQDIRRLKEIVDEKIVNLSKGVEDIKKILITKDRHQEEKDRVDRSMTIPDGEQSSQKPDAVTTFFLGEGVRSQSALLKPVPIPQFDGSPEKAASWLKQFKLATSLNFLGEKDKLRGLGRAFTDDAFNWFTVRYLPSVNGDPPSWDHFEKSFSEAYLRESIRLNQYDRIRNRRQKPGERVSKYFHDILVLCYDYDPNLPETEIIGHVLRGLDQAYKNAVCQAMLTHRTLRYLEESIRLIEDAQTEEIKQRYGDTRQTNRSNPVTTQARDKGIENSVIICRNCLQKGHIVRQCKQPIDFAKIKENKKMLAKQKEPISQVEETAIEEENAAIHEPTWRSAHVMGAEPRGKLGRPSPRVNIMVNGTQVVGVIDSGATISIMSNKLRKELKLPLQTWPYQNLRMANSALEKPIGLVTCMIQVEKLKTKATFCVMDNTASPLLIGCDFCEKHKACINYGTRKVTFQPNTGNRVSSEEELAVYGIMLSQDQPHKQIVENILTKFKDIFAESQADVGLIKNVTHRINTGDHPPVSSKPHSPTPDADAGLGAVLLQEHKEIFHPVYFISRTLSKHEINYGVTEKECLAIVWAVQRLRHFLYGRQFTVVTDHCGLCWLTSVKNPVGRLARWAMKLQPFTFEIKYKSGKLHGDADCLSRYPLDEPGSLEEEDDDQFYPNINSIEETVPDDNIKQAQDRDEQCNKIKQLLEGDSGRDSLTKRVKKRLQKRFVVKEGILYRLWGNRVLPVIPKDLRANILKEVHDSLMSGGHLGYKKTLSKAKLRFYWKGMSKEIFNYCRSCKACQLRKHTNRPPQGEMVPIPISDRVFGKVSLDLIELPLSANGNKYAVVINDQLTKYAVAEPIKTADSTEVIEVLYKEWVLRFGIPDALITDQGTNLMSVEFENFLKEFGIKHSPTTPHHPRSDGQTERFNCYLGTALGIYAYEEPKQWDRAIKELLFAYNCAEHRTTKYTPFYLAHGIEPKLPIEGQLGLNNHTLGITDQFATFQKAREFAKINILASQAKSKEYFDRNRVPCSFNAGDRVLIKVPILKKGRNKKFVNRYKGPFKIVERLGPVVYKIKVGKRFQTIHGERLKPYFERLDLPGRSTQEEPDELYDLIFSD